MRKCFLCGSILRRRAEFCRYCTVRQSGAPPTDAIPAASGAHGDVRAVQPVAPAPVDTTPLEQAMTPPSRPHEDERHRVEFHVERETRPETPPPAIYEIDPTPTHDNMPLPPALTPTAPQPPISPPRAPTHPTGRRHRTGQNATEARNTTDARNLTDASGKGNGTRPGRPPGPGAHIGANGESNNRNGVHTHSSTGNGNGKNGSGDAEPAKDPTTRTGREEADAGDANNEAAPRPRSLVGFEHFPDASASPKVRWG